MGWKLRFASAALLVGLLCARAGAIETAGELFVSLDAADDSAGTDTWTNDGTLSDFVLAGDPLGVEVFEVNGAPAVSFNEFALGVYQSQENAPDGLVGADPTRSIEAWVLNPDILEEETIVAWSHRGGPDGTNMSFNYGSRAEWGAVGHWGGPDHGWNDGLDTPVAGEWHHLAYTYDGTTTRVYADGELISTEVLGAGVINTYAGTKITVAAQLQADGTTIEFGGNQGVLLINRLRVHDGVLSDAQVLANYEEEKDGFDIIGVAPAIVGAPDSGEVFDGDALYSVQLSATGFPKPELAVTEPDGASITPDGLLTWDIPSPTPSAFDVTVTATNVAGVDTVTWEVIRKSLPDGPEDVVVAGELFVDLRAEDLEGTDFLEWENQGTLGDFELVAGGAPFLEEIDGATALTLNSTGALDAYQSFDLAPAGLTGLDPTRSIEVWAYNPEIPVSEETMVAWGHRGGPEGTNMSFNYSPDASWGAVGHWGGGPDHAWNNGTSVPLAGQWHHLAYTYDGETTRVYSDGDLVSEEFLGFGIINTHPDTKIVIGAQNADATSLVDAGQRAILSITRVRVHDEVLSGGEIRNNYLAEKSLHEVPKVAPTFVRSPEDTYVFTTTTSYAAPVTASGWPLPVVTVVEPAGATITDSGQQNYTVSYTIPDPPPGSITVTVRATNSEGSADASWTITVREPPAPDDPIEVAQDLVVSLDAASAAADIETGLWPNDGSMETDFVAFGLPALTEIDGATGVEFNAAGAAGDAFQSDAPAPAGLVGPDPTRSIEAWVYNPGIAPEETVVALGRRGGPAGANMSFNYGSDPTFGSVGHWGGADLGWGVDVPPAAQWNHLVYTYDGTTTRVYANGVLASSEIVGPGVINTHADLPITLAAQLEPDGVTLNVDLGGTLSIGRVRIHDGVLLPEQVAHNHQKERTEFPLPPPPEPGPLEAPPLHRYSFTDDASDSIGGADGAPIGLVSFVDGQAVLENDLLIPSNDPDLALEVPTLGGYIDLPNGLISALGTQVTFEVWFTWDGPSTSSWQRIFDFGTSAGGEDNPTDGNNTYYVFATPRSGDNTLRYGYRVPGALAGTEQNVNGPAIVPATAHHLVVVWDEDAATVTLYLDGVRLDQGIPHFSLAELVDQDVNNWLGRSQWGADVLFDGAYDELRLYDYPLSASEILGNLEAGPDCLGLGDPECGVTGNSFLRGDADASGQINITDGIFILNFLFLGGPDPSCKDAADPDNSGAINITDGIYVLNFLFLGGPPPQAPHPGCGEDPEGDDDELDCAVSHPSCL